MNYFFSDNISKKIACGLFFLLISRIFIGSCSHGDLPEPEVNLSLEQDFLTILADLNTVQHDIESAVSGSGCASASAPVAIDTFYTKSTIDFTGGTCSDNLTRTGIIEYYHHGTYALGTLRDSIVFVSYTIDGRTIKGYRKVLSPTPNVDPSIRNISIFDSVVLVLTGEKTYKLKSNPYYYRIDSTSKMTSSIYGSFSGSTYNGEQFAVSITLPTSTAAPTHLTSFPLKYDTTCSFNSRWRYPLSGALTFVNKSQNLSRTLNFERVIQTYDPQNPDVKLFNWFKSTCGRDTATLVSPRGNIYYIPVN